ncbi:EF-P 5-aminopentanol modification-associated protein YfmF [Robertmurraya andreesenii]|uniref:Zn-dependent peptidase n=1 Tax=Anoxybacillus andreesenii TaxID=1325932 RepID=A0ABT9V732_9BACL|nr:pitrilysin family protein [Robertmurraya andreesenii]MDQ0156749.1 putative Zn-dependent peptidase [Robertmurraya andreesenii]
MAVVTETIHEMKGYKLHIVKTEKYKTNTFVWKMKAPLSKEDVTHRALLPYVLQSNAKAYPTSTVLRSYLDELYGASLFVDLAKKGEYHVITFTMEVANEKFLSDPTPLLKKALDFLSEILMNPNVTNQAFDKDTVEKEKRTLKQRIQSVYDDKMKYSSNRLVEEMCKGEKYALHVHGDMASVDEITSESLFAYYEKAMAEDEIDLYVIGDISEEEVKAVVNEKLQLNARQPKLLENVILPSKRDVQEIQEVQDVKQGKLNIGFRTNVVYGDEDYFALQVMNGIYGGFAHSKLFINVREKASLAYYAASRLESHKGLMMVMSGIDYKNYEQAVTIIKEQLTAMKKGDFSDQELSQTKAVIRNQFLETLDTARGIVEVLYHNVVAQQNISLDEWLEEMDKATKEDIIKVSEKIQLDTIYFLTGTEAAQ